MAKSYKASDVSQIKEVKCPYIVQLNNKNYMHFVVIYKLYEDKILMMDPAVGKVTMDMFDFTNVWTGYLMLFEKIKPISVITM